MNSCKWMNRTFIAPRSFYTDRFSKIFLEEKVSLESSHQSFLEYISAVVISQVGDGLLSYLTQDAHADDIKNGEYLTMISEDLNQRMIPTTTVNLLQLENNEYPSEQHIQLATDFLDQHRNWVNVLFEGLKDPKDIKNFNLFKNVHCRLLNYDLGL